MSDRPKIIGLIAAWVASLVIVAGIFKAIGYNEAMTGSRMRDQDAANAKTFEMAQHLADDYAQMHASTQPSR